MILVGNQRGGAKDLALHLLKEENDHAEVHELRGFASDTLMGALMETYAISRGTKAKQFMFSLSLNPPPEANVPVSDFESAIERVEKKLGLGGQPRAIVFHEKNGRRHAHAVWSRIDGVRMKAVQMSHSGNKLMDVSRELYREHGWTMPPGLIDRSKYDPLNFTLEEWQQAKRVGRDPRDIKIALQDAWAMSDSKAAFTHALAERGFQLARGDRRGFVAVDYRGEAYALRSWADVKTKELRERLGAEADCQSVDDAKDHIATGMLAKMRDFQRELDGEAQSEREAFEHQRKALVVEQRAERNALTEQHQERQAAENLERQARFRRGFKGLWDRLRGERRRIMELNMREAQQGSIRDRAEKDRLVQEQLTARRGLALDRTQQRAALNDVRQEIIQDTQTYRDMQTEWRTKAHPPTAPTEDTKRIVSKNIQNTNRQVPPEQDAKQEVTQPPSALQHDFDDAAKNARRRAFMEKRAGNIVNALTPPIVPELPLPTPDQPSEPAEKAPDINTRRETFRQERTESKNIQKRPTHER